MVEWLRRHCLSFGTFGWFHARWQGCRLGILPTQVGSMGLRGVRESLPYQVRDAERVREGTPERSRSPCCLHVMDVISRALSVCLPVVLPTDAFVCTDMAQAES